METTGYIVIQESISKESLKICSRHSPFTFCWWEIEYTDYIPYREIRPPLFKKMYPLYESQLYLVVRALALELREDGVTSSWLSI